jgi:hypothetical protein
LAIARDELKRPADLDRPNSSAPAKVNQRKVTAFVVCDDNKSSLGIECDGVRHLACLDIGDSTPAVGVEDRH